MEAQERRPKHRLQIDRQKLVVLVLAVLAVILAAALCINIFAQKNIHGKYIQARNSAGEVEYNQLYMLCQTFDQVAVPDQEAAAVPKMRNYYLVASAVNSVLANGFGSNYALLSGDNVLALDAALTSYENALRGGLSTADAKSQLSACVETIRQTLLTRFKNDVLQPA